MIDSVALALADPTIRDWYMMFCMGVMMGPIIILAIWFHWNIGKTEGGRRLMEWQGRHNIGRALGPGEAVRNLRSAGIAASDISSGKYGTHARAMQNRAYWIIGCWLLANFLFFGILIWADEVNKVAG